MKSQKKCRKFKTILIVVVIIVFFLLLFVSTIKNRISKEIVVEENSKKTEITWEESKKEEFNIKEIIDRNNNSNIKEKYVKQIVELEYETEYKNNSNLPKGYMHVLQQGQDGKQELIIMEEYNKEELINSKQVGRRIITSSINRIVEVGTSKHYNSYTIKIGDSVYSTPYELDIKEESNKNSNVIIRIDQNSELKIKKKSKSWYYVQYNTYYGWVEQDCVTYIKPNTKIEENNNIITYSKKQLLATISKDMQLNKPSGLTLEQFKKIFEKESKDKNKIFSQNAEYFYYAEQAYGINGIFVAAIAIHESAWGTSRIAKDKMNLFGYGAYDMSAYSSAYSYNGYAAGIDMVSRVLVKHYLNKKGTSIYNGEVATGKYYNGNNVTGVNKKYATDTNWSNCVYQWMEYLYNKI